MPELNENQIRDLKRLKDFAEKSDVHENLPLYDKLGEIAEHLKAIAEKENSADLPEVQKIQVEGAELVSIKGEKGDRGETPTDDHLLELITPLIPAPIQGPKGEKGDSIVGPMGPAGRDGESIVGPKGEDGKDGSPDNAEQVKEKIMQIGLKIEDIEDLEKTLSEMKKGIERRPIFGGGGFNYGALNSHLIDDETPSGTVNGVNTTFTLVNKPNPVSSLKVFVNGQRMRVTEDYTFSGVTITFNTPPPTGSILLVDYRT